MTARGPVMARSSVRREEFIRSPRTILRDYEDLSGKLIYQGYFLSPSISPIWQLASL